MSSQHVTYVRPLKVTGPDGTVVYLGAMAALGHYYWAKAGEAITRSQAVMVDPTKTIVPRTDYLAGETIPDSALFVLKSTATATQGVPIGVALNNAAADGVVLVAGFGSIVPVISDGAGAIGKYLKGSGVAGTLTPDDVPGVKINYGIQCKASIAGGAGTRVGILVGSA